MRLSAEDFRSHKWTPRVEEVPVPEIKEGATLPVRQWSARDKTTFEMSLKNSKTGASIPSRMQQLRERLVIAYCIDESGVPVFRESDIQYLATVPASVIDRILEAGNALGNASEEDIEELAGNSDASL